MDRQEVKSFLSFLEAATWEELLDRQNRFLKLKRILSSNEARSDVRFCLKLLDQEVRSRFEADQVSEKKSS